MKVCSKNIMENLMHENIGPKKYDQSSVKGCEIQILVFHLENWCGLLVEYLFNVQNIPPALVLVCACMYM